MVRRIKRNYRLRSPEKALIRFKTVRHAMTNNPNFPPQTWGANTTSLQEFFKAVDIYEVAYNEAVNGDRVKAAARDTIKNQIFDMLDEIAAHLEATSVRNPDALFTSGFDVLPERRSRSRRKVLLTASTDYKLVNLDTQGKGLGSSSAVPGAWNYEIHITTKDPSVEGSWMHLGIYPDPASMLLENLDPGNYFSRMRPHGREGAGPWSATVSTTIT